MKARAALVMVVAVGAAMVVLSFLPACSQEMAPVFGGPDDVGFAQALWDLKTRINQNVGRDHYPKAFSGLLLGGGIKGGQRYGKTDETGENVVENLVHPSDFNATIGYALGLPLNQVLFSPSKRPFTAAHNGRPMVELFV